MGSFFVALFGTAILLGAYISDSSSSRRAGARIKSDTDRVKFWMNRVLDGGADYNLDTKIYRDSRFAQELVDKFNALLDSMPEMKGNRMTPLSYSDKNVHDKVVVLKMMELAKIGKIPYMWMNGNMWSYQLFSVLYERPSKEALIAFYKWYENEMRTHGEPNTRIVAELSQSGYPICWYFVEGTLYPGQYRRLW